MPSQVLIDHSTRPGFSNIIEAREYLLNLGRREVGDLKADDSQIRGCHVVAPVSDVCHVGILSDRYVSSVRMMAHARCITQIPLG